MRIGLLTSYFALGDDSDSGIGQHFRILADALAGQGHEVRVFYLCGKDAAPKARRALGAMASRWSCTLVTAEVPVWLARASERSWPASLLLKHLWLARAGRKAILASHRSSPLEIIETHSYDLPALFLLADRRRPPILTRVSTTLGQMIAISTLHSRVLRWEAALERRIIRRSDVLVTHTAQHRDALCGFEGHDPARFSIVPHGLPDPGGHLGMESPADGTVEFLFVGRFESRKGIDVLLAAIPEIVRGFPRVVFTLAGSRGDGSDWSAFERRYPELLGTRVISLGRVPFDTLTALYQRCHVLVAPSRYESFGLIYVEAMSYAKPVIGCRAGGIPEVIREGITGLIAEPGDVPSLVACMKTMAGDAPLRRRMGEAARLDFLSRFSAQRLAEVSVELYRQILSAGPRH